MCECELWPVNTIIRTFDCVPPLNQLITFLKKTDTFVNEKKTHSIDRKYVVKHSDTQTSRGASTPNSFGSVKMLNTPAPVQEGFLRWGKLPSAQAGALLCSPGKTNAITQLCVTKHLHHTANNIMKNIHNTIKIFF